MTDPRAELAAAARHLRGLAEWMAETRADLGGPAAPAAPVAAVAPVAPLAPAMPTASAASAAEALRVLRDDVLGDCRRCKLCDGRRHIVFGVGDPAARVMFVGEGPGADEDRLGEPFVGAAGKLLDKIIAAMGLRRESVYIANIVKCRPPRNRDPEADEVRACEPFLKAQIRAIRPQVLVALGRIAVTTLLRDPGGSLSRHRGRWLQYEGIPLRATYHPAALLRDERLKRPTWEDVRAVMDRLGLEPSGGGG